MINGLVAKNCRRHLRIVSRKQFFCETKRFEIGIKLMNTINIMSI